MLFLLYLSQLLFDSLKVLGTPRVKTKSAAWVHLGERHLLWRRAMKRLDRKPPAYFRKHAPRWKNHKNNGAHTSCAGANKMHSTLFAGWNAIYLLSRHPYIYLYVTARKSIKQSCCADFYVWLPEIFRLSLPDLMLAIFLPSGSFTHLSSK